MLYFWKQTRITEAENCQQLWQ